MIFKDDIKRYILSIFKKGFEDGLSENEIIQNLPEFPGSETDKQNLYTDCKAYLFLDLAFINHPQIAITLAEKYMKNNSHRDINLVDEKLYSMYSLTNQTDLSNELIEKLLKKEPNNKWTIAKKLNLLRGQGMHSEALEFISRNYELVKNDPAIFHIQYKIVYKLTNGDPNAIIKLCKRIPYLDFGNIPEKRLVAIEKLQEYLKRTYILEKSCEDKKPLRYVRNLIKNKIKKEKNSFVCFEISEENQDLNTVHLINNVIKSHNYKEETLAELLESIQNQTIKFFMQCQVSHFQGKSSKELVEKIKDFSRKNSSVLDEYTKKSVRVLNNLLTGSLRNIYLHEPWINFQNQYFYKILNPDKQKKDNTVNQNKSLGPTL